MSHILYPASERGFADHGWLKAAHTFSFASWYNPQKVHFGVLRVLNDDIVSAGMGFGMHPHDNMEIITIPFSGTLAHKDSMGNSGTISYGEIQVMSAGSGITHSEFNHSRTEAVSLFQIWLFPNQQNVTPRYDQISYDTEAMNDDWLQIVSPSPEDAGSWIHQQAWFHLGRFKAGSTVPYTCKAPNNGMFLMVIEGSIKTHDSTLGRRDAIGIRDESNLEIEVLEDSFLLLMDLPMA
ncbi:MAG: pirin family protein [Chitinophagaceae bacterium]|nr:pirin family protein [Chitinophagaceae bacterium]